MEFMDKKKEINEFAVKYHNLYVNPQTTEDEFKDGFAEQCFALGFDSDCENRFSEVFSEDAFRKNEALDKVIDNIEDIELLGSAVFSKWEYVTHQAGHPSLLDDEPRKWFITALGRLAVISADPAEHPFIFTGTLQKIRIKSNNVCVTSFPSPDEETEQHLTISADGGVWISRYRYGAKGDSREPIEESSFEITPESVEVIMKAVGDYFGDEYDIGVSCNVGSWDLTLTKENGRIFRINGPLDSDLQGTEGGLSDLIRSKLGRNDLFVFDGNIDAVSRIEIKYKRNTEIKSGAIPEWATWEPVTGDCEESVSIDRASGTLEYIREIGSGCKVTNTYRAKRGVAKFLDGVDMNAFEEVEGNPPDAVEDPSETKTYEITLFTKHGSKRVIKGTFDKNGLPADWPDFIKGLENFMAFYGHEELFDEGVYGKAKRRQSDCIFCNVLFSEGDQTYCYLADSDDYLKGDLVVVPAGENNREAIVRIKSIEYHSANEAPYPMEKTKHILRKYEMDKEFALSEDPWIQRRLFRRECRGCKNFKG